MCKSADERYRKKLQTTVKTQKPLFLVKKAWSLDFKAAFGLGALSPYNGDIHAVAISNYSSQPAATRNSGPIVRLLEPHQKVLGWRGACDCSRRRLGCRADPWFRDCRCVGNNVNDWNSRHSCQGSPGALKTNKSLTMPAKV
jgi:hypothetical protein